MNSFSLLTLGLSVLLNNSGNIEGAYRYTSGVQLYGSGNRLYTYFFKDVAPNFKDSVFFQISKGTSGVSYSDQLWYGSLTGKGIAENAWCALKGSGNSTFGIYCPLSTRRAFLPFSTDKRYSVTFFKDGEKATLIVNGVQSTASFHINDQLSAVSLSNEPQFAIYRQNASEHEWNAAYYNDGHYNILCLPMVDIYRANSAVYNLEDNTLIEL